MLNRLTTFLDRRSLLVGSLLVLFFLCPASWMEKCDDWSSSLFFNLRGGRACSDRLLLVSMDSQDIQSMGGWPLTRDYYGFFLHIMAQQQAATTAIDLLFSDRDRRYGEYDLILSNYMQQNNNVVLPMAFTSFKENLPAAADHPSWPHPLFRHACSAVGFSNMQKSSTILQMPVVAAYRDSLIFSFGLEISRVYWGGHPAKLEHGRLQLTDPSGRVHTLTLTRSGGLRLDPFDLRISSISLLQLLATFRTNPDSLDLKNKIVILAPTAAGQAYLKNSSSGATLPATLLHATLAENIIENRLLKTLPAWIEMLLIIFLAVIPLYAAQRQPRWRILLLPLLFTATSLLLFCTAHLLLDQIWPLLAWTGGYGYAGYLALQRKKQEQANQRLLWNQQIEQTGNQLVEAEKQLAELAEQLAGEGLEKQRLSEETTRLFQEKMSAVQTLEKHLADLQPKERPATATRHFDLIYSAEGKMAQVLAMTAKVSDNDIPVLILGETGSGKELVAQAIHQAGRRRQKAFMAVNCGALAETLLESELFGHEKGSFTGAVARRRGLFELANAGTLFLDEITETSHAMQAKLLRVLQEKVFYRLGGEQPITVDVRIIAASNRNIREQVNLGHFRSDLYYRLNGITIELPSLRERQEDIPALAHHFLHKYGYQEISGFSEQAGLLLQQYPWPGNVRELENVVRRAALLAASEQRTMIQAQDLGQELQQTTPVGSALYVPLDQQILDMLRKFHFSRDAITRTARALGDRDRGTVTEYFRGLCFAHLVKAQFNVQQAAAELAQTSDRQTVAIVTKKMAEYIANLKKNYPADGASAAPFRGLPKKYHADLQEILNNLDRILPVEN